MGTRHLIAVVLDGKFRVAQHGSWDGYPEGAGSVILEFLKGANLDAFKEKVRLCEFRESPYRNDDGQFPASYSDTGAKILHIINTSIDPVGLIDRSAFGANSLFCEFAYVLDLDSMIFEFYKGFNKEPVPDSNRFKAFPLCTDNDGYHHVRLVKVYPFASLPTVEQMCYDTGEDDE